MRAADVLDMYFMRSCNHVMRVADVLDMYFMRSCNHVMRAADVLGHVRFTCFDTSTLSHP